MISIDKLDSEILGRLGANARAGITELASAMGVARNTVQARIRRMEDIGVLRGFGPRIDLEAAGVGVQAFIALELDQRQMPSVVDALIELPNVLEINTQAGREDLLVRVAAPTHHDLQEVALQMVHVEGVRHTVTTLIVSTPLAFRTQPLLDRLTEKAGFGRSTPAST